MTDVFSRSKRSAVMARIRARGNEATELAFMRLLRQHRITGWRRHLAVALPGRISAKGRLRRPMVRPDFVFPKSKLVVFIDGCFWHGCPVHCTPPSSNSEFWSEKLSANKRRDLKVNRQLRNARWSVIRIWEHQLHDVSRLMARLRTKLQVRETH